MTEQVLRCSVLARVSAQAAEEIGYLFRGRHGISRLFPSLPPNLPPYLPPYTMPPLTQPGLTSYVSHLPGTARLLVNRGIATHTHRGLF